MGNKFEGRKLSSIQHFSICCILKVIWGQHWLLDFHSRNVSQIWGSLCRNFSSIINSEVFFCDFLSVGVTNKWTAYFIRYSFSYFFFRNIVYYVHAVINSGLKITFETSIYPFVRYTIANNFQQNFSFLADDEAVFSS